MEKSGGTALMIKKIALGSIALYQKLPLYSFSHCRFYPSCSQYMYEAIAIYGVFAGFMLGMRRLLRCHPFGKSGFDPVIKSDSLLPGGRVTALKEMETRCARVPGGAPQFANRAMRIF